ncbi:acetolactate synthase small subunit [Halosquirtibacter laminarini]|uniref:acetolactate synthase small subunit n=1 Tax=Halosquirtibacter laminarini TaxID=3374600 RepID=UPI00374793E1
MQKQEFTISAYTENTIGLLNRITIMFTRRRINIESLTVSESAIAGISKFTIVVNDLEDRITKLCVQIERHVEVLKCFYHRNDEIVHQEVALYKVSSEALLAGDQIEKIVRAYHARILEITPTYTVIEKTGHKAETQELFDKLNPYGVIQFIRSGRVAITRSNIEKLSEFLKERDRVQTVLDKQK